MVSAITAVSVASTDTVRDMAEVNPADGYDGDDAMVADVFAKDCSSRRIVENIAGKWGMLALAALHEGSYRFNALRRRVDGVSEKMLAQTLQALERDGLVRRHVQTTIPPHVEYSLTPFGERVATTIVELIHLVQAEVDAGRP